MTIIDRVAKAFEAGIANLARTRTREQLLSQSDHVLADAGFSRELLQSGNVAWPWLLDDAAAHNRIRAPRKSAVSQDLKLPTRKIERLAVRELREMSDAELHDLGISRGGIVDAVRNGRQGYERAAA